VHQPVLENAYYRAQEVQPIASVMIQLYHI